MITVDFNRLAIRPGDRILDLGCGSGRHTAAACRPPHVFAVGVDVSLAELRDAKNRLRLHERLGECDGRWGLCAADTTHLPFAHEALDLVICCEVLEHIRDDRRAVAEIVRVLRPGGALVVSVPRCWPEQICWSLSRTYRLTKGGHVRIYRRAALVALLEAAGLRLSATHWAHSLHTPYWWLKCLVGPQRDDHLLVNLYQRFLTWDILRRPRITWFCDRLLNPLLGKSLVLYFRKN